MEHLLHSSFLWTLIAPYIGAIVFSVICVAIFWLLSKRKLKNKQSYMYIEAGLKVMKNLFGQNFGGKADDIFSIWLDCLEKVENGEWTEQQMLEEFCKLVDATKGISLSFEDKKTVEAVTKASIQTLGLQNNTQVSISSVRSNL
jgi:hypothetical protein